MRGTMSEQALGLIAFSSLAVLTALSAVADFLAVLTAQHAPVLDLYVFNDGKYEAVVVFTVLTVLGVLFMGVLGILKYLDD